MAGDQWYYSKGDEKHGPVMTAQLRELAAKGELARTDLIWREGMAEWTPASQAKGLFPQQGGPPPLPSGSAPQPPQPPAGPVAPQARGAGRRPTGRATAARWLGRPTRLAFLPRWAKVIIGVGAWVVIMYLCSLLIEDRPPRTTTTPGRLLDNTASEPYRSATNEDAEEAEHEARMQAIEKYRRQQQRSQDEARQWSEMAREPLF